MPIIPSIKRYTLATLILIFAARSWAEMPEQSRQQQIRQGLTTTLPGSDIVLTSNVDGTHLSAEIVSILPHSYNTVVDALDNAANWCLFMPLHFNIKACTHEQDHTGTLLHIYSGRKYYQTPDDSYLMDYRFNTVKSDDRQLQLQLSADRGPANTRDYRIEVTAEPAAEGTLLHIRSSYQPSLLSSVLTASYLSTLGRDKIGFSRDTSSSNGAFIKGIRGVIERNVMRYQLAIDAFLTAAQPAEISGHEAMLAYWFERNDSYPQQLHEMPRDEYLTIKRQEWENQTQMQQVLNNKARLAVVRISKEGS